MKSKLIYLCGLVLLAKSYQAQEVLSSGGESFSTDQCLVDFTLGELAIETIGTEDILSQGFHQTLLLETSILEEEQFDYSLFPNPAKDWITLEVPLATKITSLTITDMTGRIVLNLSNEYLFQGKIELPNLPSGMYLFTLSTDGMSRSENTKLLQIN